MKMTTKFLVGVFSSWGRNRKNGDSSVGSSSKVTAGYTTSSTSLAERKTSKFDYKAIRERQDLERERLEKWRKEFKEMRDHSNYSLGTSANQWTYAYPTSIDNATIVDNTPTTIIVNGRDIIKEIDEMRDALLLLKRDVDMESKYPRLKELKDEYERALEKYKTFEALK